MIDVAAGEKIPRKGGPSITKSDLLIINQIDMAPPIAASLAAKAPDTKAQRGSRPFAFADLKTGQGLAEIIAFILDRGMLGLGTTGG